MRYTLNFEADKPTVNGRIYPKDLIVSAFDGKEVPVFYGNNPSDDTFVGRAICTVEEGQIVSEVTLADTLCGNLVKEMLEAGEHPHLTSKGIGKTVDERLVAEFELESLFFISEDEPNV